MGTVDLVVLVESPGSVAARHPTRRAGRPPSRRAEHRQDLPEVSRRSARSRDRRAAHARGPGRGDALPAQSARRARAADRRERARSTSGASTTCTRSCAGARTSPSCPRTRSARRSTCSRGAIRPIASTACGRASCGIASRAGSAAREGAQRVAVQSGGTIPDRGLFGVFLPDGGRVGELDEEMVYESRVGECFVLGASTWRIEEITVDRVVVTPAPGEPAKTPFWKGDRPGRPLELGRALGALVRELRGLDGPRRRSGAARRRARRARRVEPAHVPRRAGRSDRRDPRRPHDRHRTLPRRDRRLARVHPHAVRFAGARAVGARRSRNGSRAPTCRCRCCGATTASSCASPSRSTTSRPSCCCPIPTRSTSCSSRACPNTSLFASKFRENAARALAVPPPPPGRAHPAVAATPARGRPARGRERLPDVPDAAGDDARMPARRLRRSRAARGAHRDPIPQAARRTGRDPARVAVRAVAAVRLDRGVHVRGRRAARRTPRHRARARPRPAARPHGRRGAARAARSRGARRARARAATADPDPSGAPRRRPARPARRSRPAHPRRGARPLHRRSRSRGSTRCAPSGA